MKLDKIASNPRAALNYLERFVNNGSPSGFTWKYTTSKSTSPLLGDKSYKLMVCYANDDFVSTYGNYPKFLNSDPKAILIHPDNAKDERVSMFDIEESGIQVTPTSSARTVQLCDYPGYLKLNYWGMIGRVNRDLTTDHINSSIEITQELINTFQEKSDCFSQLSLLPEYSARALVYNDLNFGNVYRSEAPVGGGAERVKYLIPFFSLFSVDRNNPDDKALLLQLSDIQGSNILELVLNKILYPVIEYYFLLIIHLGFQPEWHSQNLLLGLDDNFEIVSFVMRDLESIDVDSTLRKQLGLKDVLKSFPYKHISLKQYNYRIQHSMMFDFKLGKYLIDPLVKLVSYDDSIDQQFLYNRIKGYSQKFIRLLPHDFFPQDNSWYAVKPVIIDRTKTDRPYINMGVPKFR